MLKIKDMPLFLRPKEKAFHYGITSLTDIELLAIIINNGYKNKTAIEIASQLIYQYDGINNLFNQDILILNKIKGIGKNKSLLIGVINEIYKRIYQYDLNNNSKDIFDYLIKKYQMLCKDNNQECVYLIYINNLNKISKEELIYQGSKKAVLISLEEIINKVKLISNKFILIHTHITNKVSPSDEDILLTDKLQVLSKQYGLILIDHIIVSKNDYYSLKNGKF